MNTSQCCSFASNREMSTTCLQSADCFTALVADIHAFSDLSLHLLVKQPAQLPVALSAAQVLCLLSASHSTGAILLCSHFFFFYKEVTLLILAAHTRHHFLKCLDSRVHSFSLLLFQGQKCNNQAYSSIVLQLCDQIIK